MTLKRYLFFMVFATLLCAGSWLEVIFFVNPEKADLASFCLFYCSLFLFLWGVASIIGFITRYFLHPHDFAYNQAKTAFRQGLLLSLLLTLSLFLQGLKLLVWWNSLLLIVLLTSIEFLFLKSNPSADESIAS